PPALQPVAVGLSALGQQVFDGQNAERGRSGLAPLRLDAGLTSVAQRRAADMATRGYFAHTSPTGETAFSLIDAAGIPAPYAAENIGFNSYPEATSAASVLAAFLASPGHRANILSSRFTRVGVGVAVSASGIKYYAVVFAGP
ncbi:MAG TPA: CAP domain-containing protein, partial [Dehalococcoidia bacterium]|nr:CAP domain-containing protein [Dehalococcoidia bacterium]